MSNKRQKPKTKKLALNAEALFDSHLNRLVSGIKEWMIQHHRFDVIPALDAFPFTWATLSFKYRDTDISLPNRILEIAVYKHAVDWSLRLKRDQHIISYSISAPGWLVRRGFVPLRDLRCILLGKTKPINCHKSNYDPRTSDPLLKVDGWSIAYGDNDDPDQLLVHHWPTKHSTFLGACKRLERAVGPSDILQQEIEL